MTYLYIKRHSVTGKLYFGKTNKNPESYLGSGTHWKNHIKKHGKDFVETLWYCFFHDQEECTKFALMFSEQQNIVESNDWLNLVPENGMNGTSSCKGRYHFFNTITGEEKLAFSMPLGEGWIKGSKTRGTPKKSYKIIHNKITGEQKYIECNESIPENWSKGRLSSKLQLAALAKLSSTAVIEKMRKSKKGLKPIYNIVTLEEKWVKPDYQLPNDWKYGRSPSSIRHNWKQSSYQKAKTSETMKKRFLVKMLDGTTEHVDGLGKWLKSKKIPKSSFEYHRNLNKLQEKYGIVEMTPI